MAERPLECGECRRPIAIHYTEMVGGVVNEFIACAQCPVVQRRLHGDVPAGVAEGVSETSGKGSLCCGTCGTTLEAVQIGHVLGCSNCYEVFADLLLHDLQAGHKLSKRVAKGKKAILHIGRTPGEQVAASPVAKLEALNEALKETLAREDYEQAASLRDQIKRLTDAPSPPEAPGLDAPPSPPEAHG